MGVVESTPSIANDPDTIHGDARAIAKSVSRLSSSSREGVWPVVKSIACKRLSSAEVFQKGNLFHSSVSRDCISR
jgi:hypothetical protein